MTGTFKWDEDGSDPLDGFDTSSEPSPELVQPKPRPQQAPPKPQLPKPSVKPNRVAEVIEELEESPDPAELTEAEWRLEKAGFYRAVINSQLLSSDHPAAVEVEVELQKWAREQLETLLGLRVAGVVAVPQAIESPFSQEETEVLKSLAARALGRQTQQAQPTQAPVIKKDSAPLQAVQPATAKPKAQIAPVSSEEPQRRGRGRPRKNPCRICGKMECEHKRTAPTAQQEPQRAFQPPSQPAPANGEMYEGMPIQFMPDGTRFVDMPNGRRYKLEIRQMTHKQTGIVREAYIPIELSKKQNDPKALPYPSEQEVIQMAALEAERNAGAMGKLQAATAATGSLTRFTGSDLINAAMGAPERESYIPQPPPGKR